MSQLLLDRLAVASLALVEFGIFAWHFHYWNRFPKYSLKRVIPWVVCVSSSIGIPLAQILLYRALTGANKVVGSDQSFLAAVIVIEGVVAICIGYWSVLTNPPSHASRR